MSVMSRIQSHPPGGKKLQTEYIAGVNQALDLQIDAQFSFTTRSVHGTISSAEHGRKVERRAHQLLMAA